MTFDAMISELALGTLSPVFKEAWETLQITPVTYPVEQYSQEAIRQSAAQLQLDETLTESSLAAARWLRGNSAALALAGLCRAMMSRTDPQVLNKIYPWPMIPASQGPEAERFYIVVFLAHLPDTLKLTRSRGIDDAVTFATLVDMKLWIDEYRIKTGRTGLDEVHWLWRHFAGRNFQLGRLQFELARYDCPFRAYRRSDGSVVTLAEAGFRFGRDGQFDGCNGRNDPEAFCSTLEETPTTITGYPVENGAVQTSPVTLSRAEWTEALHPGATGLFVHIPSGRDHGPMPPDACDASFAQAATFFARHFPDFDVQLYFSCTWLFDNQFPSLLPADSNIMHFQRRFVLLPAQWASDTQTMNCAFGGPVNDWAAAPRTNSFQRVLADFAQAGGRFRQGYGFQLTNSSRK